ncbi:MAG: hypothetical protein US74_C0006G0041 [Parcubacteria group bacterium GW2011_GWA2_38_13]|nr:MAG: hypothetical protein US74_C0006G0041 [Parcubacteria group bacterium GW2011_GWA2_38_13]
MQIAIISDSHDNLPNIYKALEHIKKLKIVTLIHCGDVCAPAVLEEFAKNFSGRIYVTCGNVDGDHEGFKRIAKKYSHITIFENAGEIKIENTNIGFAHYPDVAHDMATHDNFDIIFYGHNHKPWEEMVKNTKLLNPGTLAGLFNKATFALYDIETKNAKLVLLEKI